jgi:DNA invertase Pin-like site-specific DNA recombinase
LPLVTASLIPGLLDQHIDTSTPGGRLTFHVFAAVAQFETEIRAERQAEGIAAALQRGVRFGQKPHLSPVQGAHLRQMRQDGLLIRQLMERFGLSRANLLPPVIKLAKTIG